MTVSPIADRTPTGVTADGLPTVQIDGVVWSQAIVGNTVYAGGSFANARPAGAPVGAQLTPRSNLLAYNLTTGALITSFNHVVNGTIKTVVASPDGTRVYIGGQFTSIDGHNRYRLAAFDTATGALLPFAASVDATVNSLSVTNAVVYAGGVFSKANGANPRSRLAAFTPGGSLLAWAPVADSGVNAVLLTPDGTHVVVGGAFASLNGVPALGLGSLDATTGAVAPFAANQSLRDYGEQSAIYSLSTDGTAIYGTGYSFHGGNLEGTFSADPTTGVINWLEDCHGDTYDSYASGGQVYVVSHSHYCANIGGFPESNPRTWHPTTAFTTKVTGKVAANAETGYPNHAGQPSPSLINWFPTLSIGSYTQQFQAAWTITGDGKYVVEGGEFLDVNGTPQQGLVRFAVPALAPNKRGPMDTTTTLKATATSATSVLISWPANWDQDNDTLTYQVLRRGVTAPVFTTTKVSQFWNRPVLSFTDTRLRSATAYSYTVVARDPSGNSVRTANATVTTRGAAAVAAATTPTAPEMGQKVVVHTSVTAVAPLVPGSEAPTGSVTVSIDGKAQKPTVLSHSAASTTLGALPVGRHTVVVSYSGDATHGASTVSRTVTVVAGHSAIRVTSTPKAVHANAVVHFHATMSAVAPAVGRPTGSVIFYVDGHRRATRVLVSGGATYSTRLPRGNHTVTVIYTGSSSFLKSTSATFHQPVT